MALRRMYGFESGVAPDGILYTAGAGTIVVASDQANSGVYSLRSTPSQTVTNLGGFDMSVANAADESLAQFATRTTGALNAALPLVGLEINGNWLNVTVAANGTLTMRMNTTFSATIGTILATTAPGVYQVGVWQTFGIRWLCADAGGIAELWVDGVKLIDFAGDTKPGANATLATRAMTFGRQSTVGSAQWFDDIVAADQQPGLGAGGMWTPAKIEALRPNGAASAQFTGSDADSVDNHLLVDEAPHNAADWVETGTAGHRDVFDLGPRGETGLVLGAQAVVSALNEPGSAASLLVGLRSGAAETQSAAVGLLATVTQEIHATDVDPTTGIAFTTGDINALQLTIEAAA